MIAHAGCARAGTASDNHLYGPLQLNPEACTSAGQVPAHGLWCFAAPGISCFRHAVVGNLQFLCVLKSKGICRYSKLVIHTSKPDSEIAVGV